MTQDAAKPSFLPRIALGHTGIEVSRLALGGFHQVEISSEIVRQVVDEFLAAGGNYIETARGYGKGASEDKLGRALEGRRNQTVLCSKSGAATRDDLLRDLDDTLRLLRTDHIEFYFFHGVNTMDRLDRITGPGGALEGVQQAIDQGVIRGMGMSSHRIPMYLHGLERLPLSLILIWCNYLDLMYLPEITQEVFPLARERGVGITAMKPLGDGFLYRSVEPAMRYAFGVGADVLVCGMNDPAHVRECAAAVRQGPATPEKREAILRDAVELGQYACRQCGRCSDALMELFRLEGYCDRQMIDYLPHDPADYALRLRLAGWFSLADIARERFHARGWQAQGLLDAAANVACPYRIDVPRKTKLALAKLHGKTPNRQ